MRKLNKKLIYLSIFLILALFLVSACKEAVGKISTAELKSNVDYLFELSENLDLTSDSKVPGLTVANTIHIKSSRDNQIKLPKTNFFNLSKDKLTNEVWLTIKDQKLYVFYKDKQNLNKKTFAGFFNQDVPFSLDLANNKKLISEFDLAPTELPIHLSFVDYQLTDQSTTILKNIKIMYAYNNLLQGGINSLGKTKSLEEADEVQFCTFEQSDHRGGGGCTNIGTLDKDYKTSYGSTVLNPKANGANDMTLIKTTLKAYRSD